MSDWAPVEELRREHDIALSHLKQLQSAVEGHSGTSPIPPGLAPELIPQVEAIAQPLLIHFRKEEEGLYPDVQRIVAEGAPAVDILGQFFGEAADDDLTAHHLLRRRLREIREAVAALARAAGPDASPLDKLHALISLTLDLLTRHAEKESTVIFPMILRLLDESQLAAAGERIRAISAPGM